MEKKMDQKAAQSLEKTVVSFYSLKKWNAFKLMKSSTKNMKNKNKVILLQVWAPFWTNRDLKWSKGSIQAIVF